MKKCFYLLTILALLLQPGLTSIRSASAQVRGDEPQTPDDVILYVQPGATGVSCSDWGATTACELQTALAFAEPGDEIWVAQGVYKPTSGIPYTSCQEIRQADPTASDGYYLIQNDGNAFQVYCADMVGTPKEYLTPYYENYSQYTAGGTSPGTDVRTNYNSVRLLPDTLQVDISDQTFTTSNGGSLQHGSTLVTSMPYGVAMDCKGSLSQTGVARIDLRETPFAIHPDEKFITGGYIPNGTATPADNNQVVSLQGGGNCGWIQPGPDIIDNPYNDAGGPVLELEHILPERIAAFQLESGVAIYGGFAGTETSREQRNWVTNVTTLSGDIGVEGDNRDNSYQVVTGMGVDRTAILDGFTITLGNTNLLFSPYGSGGVMDITGGGMGLTGGGMFNYESSPMLANLTFSGNTAMNGGGMSNFNSNPALVNVTFTGNAASDSGGAMFNSNSSPALVNVSFIENMADKGSGMYNFNSSPALANVTFRGNTATHYGGGMYNASSSPKLENVTFSVNVVSDGGGGMFNDNSNPTLANVTFSGNAASDSGGGMFNRNSNPTLSNVTFSGNVVSDSGGGMSNTNSSPTLANVTFSSNTAKFGGGMSNYESNPTLTNAILWGNTPDQIYNYSGTPVVTHSDIQNGYTGSGNINADPLFVRSPSLGEDGTWGTSDDDYGDLRLQLASPAIDAGNNAAVPAGLTTDLGGHARFIDIASVLDTGIGIPPIVDMGAYEAQNTIYLPLVRR